jgi:hypothetical protein
MGQHVFQIRLYGRQGCCLCDDVEARIRLVGEEIPLRLELVDITSDPALEEKYMLTIPVVEIDGEEVFLSITSIMTAEELWTELTRRQLAQ